MTRFLRTADGGLVNADRVERIDDGARKGLQWQARATLKEGGYATLSMDKAEIENALLPVVTALPGYVRLCYYADGGDDGGPWVDRMPIVAWRIAEDIALPVTPDEDKDDTLRSGVLLPDGRVVQPFMQTFPDEDAWRGEMDRQAKAQRKAAE
jgi:hypothetical protein